MHTYLLLRTLQSLQRIISTFPQSGQSKRTKLPLAKTFILHVVHLSSIKSHRLNNFNALIFIGCVGPRRSTWIQQWRQRGQQLADEKQLAVDQGPNPCGGINFFTLSQN